LPEGGVFFENRVPRQLEVDADSEQLFRAVLNLLRNAREALESLPESQQEEKRIVVEASRQDASVVIEIADSGPGIPSAMRDRLFQPFSGAARSTGSGLGLAISRELLHAHGGDIALLSTGETGTRFRLVIPDRS
jgi:signal transduction histidine kinase